MNQLSKATLKSLIAGILLTAVVDPSFAATRDLERAIPQYNVADPTAPLIGLDNLVESDRFWPFRVTLQEEWSPNDASFSVPARPGVLVRVNPDGTARIDFAELGQHDIPIAMTDLIEASNRIRIGEDLKMAPNLILTIGNKLIDTTGDRLSILHLSRNTIAQRILCLFVDPAADDFSEIARAIAKLSERKDFQVVLFPEPTTVLHDLGVWKRLREVGLGVPFIRERYREPFTRSLLGPKDSQNRPYFQLVTRDGRMLIHGRLGPDVEDRFGEISEVVLDRVPPR